MGWAFIWNMHCFIHRESLSNQAENRITVVGSGPVVVHPHIIAQDIHCIEGDIEVKETGATWRASHILIFLFITNGSVFFYFDFYLELVELSIVRQFKRSLQMLTGCLYPPITAIKNLRRIHTRVVKKNTILK